MNAPMLTAFAPGMSVAGMIVSPISSSSARSSSVNPADFLSGIACPRRKTSEPTIAPPMRSAIRQTASLLFMPGRAWGVLFFIAGSDLAPLHGVHGVVRGARRQRHVGERWIHAGGRGHAGAVRHEHVLRVPDLVLLVEDGCIRVPAHARRAHLVDALPEGVSRILGLDVLPAQRLQQLRRIVYHVR